MKSGMPGEAMGPALLDWHKKRSVSEGQDRAKQVSSGGSKAGREGHR